MGRLEVGFVTGQGRAIGDLSLVMSLLSFSDSFGEVLYESGPRTFGLGSYSFQFLSMNVPFELGQDSRIFQNYTFEPDRLLQDTGGAPLQVTCFGTRNPDGSINTAWPLDPFAVDVRVFPGRNTYMPLFLDDSMFSVESIDPQPGDTCNGVIAVFDADRFMSINQLPIKGFISDYVSFDISGMPAGERPRLSAESGGVVAGRVFVSGDNYAVSGAGNSGNFEVLTPQVTEPIVGNFGPQHMTEGVLRPGTFTLAQIDPTDLENLRKIVALQGIWREYGTVLTGFQTWNLVTFPDSNDANVQEAVFFQRDESGKITSFFFGYVDFDLDEMHLFPVRSLVDGLFDPSDEVVISISSQLDRNGNTTGAAQITRSGAFSVTTRGALPSGAPDSGTYIVFRA